MRLFIKFLLLVGLMAILLPLSPIAVVIGAVVALYVMEHFRLKSKTFKAVLDEKFTRVRDKVRKHEELRERAIDGEFDDKDSLNVDDMVEDLKDELDRTAELDQLSDSWLAKVEAHRVQLRRSIWRGISWPIRKIARMLLSLTE